MTLSAAQTLASNQGCLEFGWPTKQTLLSPVPAMYFAAALLEELSMFGDVQRSLCFCVKAFYAGRGLQAGPCKCHDCADAEQGCSDRVFHKRIAELWKEIVSAGPKAVRSEEEEEWPQTALIAEQLSDKGPHARLALLWHNFKIARRHIGRLQTLEAQADADVNPMHVVQKDETLASIAKVLQCSEASACPTSLCGLQLIVAAKVLLLCLALCDTSVRSFAQSGQPCRHVK
jgi:hypothetical protein